MRTESQGSCPGRDEVSRALREADREDDPALTTLAPYRILKLTPADGLWSAAPLSAQPLQRGAPLGDIRLELRVGVEPRLSDELIILEGRGAIAQPLRQSRTLEHERPPAIVGAIKHRCRLMASPGRRQQAKPHFAELLSVGTERVGECEEATQRQGGISPCQGESGAGKARNGVRIDSYRHVPRRPRFCLFSADQPLQADGVPP